MAPARRQARAAGAVADVLRRHARFVRTLYDHVGNPLEWPASIPYAIRHGVSLARWDQMAADYPLTPPFGAYRDDKLAGQRTTWLPGDKFLVGDWSPRQQGDRPFRTTTDGTILIPNISPQMQKIGVWVKGTATIEWDGDEAGRTTGDAWTRIELTTKPSVGTHELHIAGTRVAVAQVEIELL
jgi:hypothetical protein